MLTLSLHMFRWDCLELCIYINFNHCALEVSVGRTTVSSCHLIWQRVGIDRFDIPKNASDSAILLVKE